MHHLCALSPQTPLLPIQTFSSHSCTTSLQVIHPCWPKSRRLRNVDRWWVSAAEREPMFEVDQDKARQALSELDQQLETLSRKQINPPKIKGLSSMNEEMREAPPEMSESYLGYTAFTLFLFSIFYNIFFLTVIKPSIDMPDDIVAPNHVTTNIEASIKSQP